MCKKNMKKYPLLDIRGKTIVVTGGCNGIGRVISSTLAMLGAKIGIIDISEENGEKIVREIISCGGEAKFFTGDVSNEAEIKVCMEQIYKKMGAIDILINNAGITKNISFFELPVEEWRKVIDVNLTGSFICSKEAAKYILKSKNGSIIMISSGSALTGSGGGPHYSASKGGLNSLIRALSRELAPKGVRVNGVAPRSIESEQLASLYSEDERNRIIKEIPIGRLGKHQDIANIVVFLCSNLSSFITGEVLLADGGRTFNR